MATRHGEIFKEINALYKNLSRLTVGQAVVDSFEYDEDSQVHKLYIFITPNDGVYKNIRTKFEVQVDEYYPVNPPSVSCLNTVYHPNIDLPDEENDGKASICVNTLDCDWQPEIGLDGCVMSILFLFYNPNPDDALSPVFGGEMSEEEFAENVRKAAEGEEVEGYKFDKLIVDDGDEDESTSVTVTATADAEGSRNVTEAEVKSAESVGEQAVEGKVLPDVGDEETATDSDKLVEHKNGEKNIFDDAIIDNNVHKGQETAGEGPLCETKALHENLLTKESETGDAHGASTTATKCFPLKVLRGVSKCLLWLTDKLILNSHHL